MGMASTKTPDPIIEEADETGAPVNPEPVPSPDVPAGDDAAPGAPAVDKPNDFRRRATVPERKAVR